MDIMNLSKQLNFYKKPEIQKAIVEAASDREVAIKFGDKGFGKRPDTLQYKNDILELAKQGATSFHVSEELWNNPLRLTTMMRKNEMDELRKGWDLVLDIDCNFLEYSKIAADLLIKALKQEGIKSVSCKFSGNHGFHIGVPFEAFPDKVHDKETKDLFPEAPRKIAAYLKEIIKKHLADGILKKDNIDKITKESGKSFEDLVKHNQFDPYQILDIDTILISSRHLYRMPYSFNEKSGLISIPINPDKVLKFKKESAHPDKVILSDFKFLDTTNLIRGEGAQLIIQAFDLDAKQKQRKIIEEDKKKKYKSTNYQDFEKFEKAIPEEFFPPCIKKILNGLEDGRKRALFVLVNFFTSVGWDYEKIEERLNEWNKKNKEPLREVMLKGHLRYHKQHKKKVLPPNCDNKMYYADLQMCLPDKICQKIKNPVNYAKRRIFIHNRIQEENNKPKRTLTDEQKKHMSEAKKRYKEFREKMKAKKA